MTLEEVRIECLRIACATDSQTPIELAERMAAFVTGKDVSDLKAKLELVRAAVS